MKQSEPRKPFFFGVLDSSLFLLHHNRINEVFEKPCQSHPFFLLFYAYVSFFDAETGPAWATPSSVFEESCNVFQYYRY